MSANEEITLEQAERLLAEREARVAKSIATGWRLFLFRVVNDIRRSAEHSIDEWYILGRVDGAMADQLQTELESEICGAMRRAIAAERLTGESDSEPQGDDDGDADGDAALA